MQILMRVLIFAVVAAIVIFGVVRRSASSKKTEETVSAQTQTAAAEQKEEPAGQHAGSSGGSSADMSAEAEKEAEPAAVASSQEAEPAADGSSGKPEAGAQEPENAAGSQTPVVTASPTPAAENTSFLDGLDKDKYKTNSLNMTVEKAKERQALLNLNDDALAEALREREVPEELIEFMQEYPETREFVVDYLFQPSTPLSKDISGEVTKGVIPHFLQWDPRWGYEMYGGSMMAVSACGPTALSEVYSGLTGKTDKNPYEMAQWAERKGYHIMGEGTSWDMMTSGAYLLGLDSWSIDATEEAILSTLRDGYPIICAMAPGDFTYFGHFIVLVSADSKGNISIRDSNSNIRTQRTWTADELLWQINSLWAYSYESYE